MVVETTKQKNVAAGAAWTEEKNPKSTKTDRRAMTKISSIDHLPIKAIKRNIPVLRFRCLGVQLCVERSRIVKPTILKSGTRILAAKITMPIK